MKQGIILTNGIPEGGCLYHFALIVDSYQEVNDFKIIPVDTLQKYDIKSKSGKGLSERGQVKKIVGFDQSMLYGQVISWNEIDSKGNTVTIVNEFSPSQDIYESRMLNGETQLLLPGIMSRNRGVLWMLGMWPNLEIPYDLEQNSHPNVVVNAWVTLQLMPNDTINYKLRSFVSVSHKFQHMVRIAAWNEGDDGNLNNFFDPVDDKTANSDFVSPLNSSLTAMRGIVVSKKQILPYSIHLSHRNVCFRRFVINDDEEFPAVGANVTFDAEKMDFLNVYSVHNVRELRDQKPFPTTDDKKCVKATIRSCEDFPGFYYCEALGCYVDDPQNKLEVWLNSQYTKSSLQVAITSSEPSDRGTPRYSVFDIVDTKKLAKLTKLKKGLQLVNELAIVLDQNGKLFFPRLPRTPARLPFKEKSKYLPGTQLLVCATSGNYRWTVTASAVHPERATIRSGLRTERTTGKEDICFHVPSAIGCKEMPYFIRCPIFGLLHTPRMFKIRKEPHTVKWRDIWVALNDCHPGEILLPAAKFKVVAMGDGDQFAEVMNTPEAHDDEKDGYFNDEEPAPVNRREYAINNANVPGTFQTVTYDVFTERKREF
ncbi:unnamed protein product [Caenorhabditis sp. 36 PRJEB53466]|nr:unnamed protein product [Caenorhabditis sp. 36 PRJEB53466]